MEAIHNSRPRKPKDLATSLFPQHTSVYTVCISHRIYIPSPLQHFSSLYPYVQITKRQIPQKEPTRCNCVVEFIIPMFLNGSTCFGRHIAHHQKLKNCNCSPWFYIHLWMTAAAMFQPSQPCPGGVGTAVPTQPGQRPVTTRVYKPEAANTVWSSWWWAECRSKHVEPSINFGIIRSITRLHLVGYFYWFILRCTDP
jgi:hypothetical protein